MAFSFVCIIHRCIQREINATQSSAELLEKVIHGLLASQPGQRVGEGIYQAAAKQFSTVHVICRGSGIEGKNLRGSLYAHYLK